MRGEGPGVFRRKMFLWGEGQKICIGVRVIQSTLRRELH